MGKNSRQRRAKAQARARGGPGGNGFSRPSGPPTGTPGGGLHDALRAHTEQSSLEDSTLSMIWAAMRDLEQGDQGGLHATLSGLTAVAARPGGQRAVERVLLGELRGAVTEAWRRGWEPADLHRLAGRRLTGAHVSLLDDAIAAELAGYAASTIDPRWPGQLEEISARVWWPRERSYLRAWLDRSGAGWASLAPPLVEVLHLLRTLPRLERIGGVPGTVVPPSGPVRPDAPPVDERILSRVRALLAKAESTTFEAEAETFTAGAQAMMARHSIDAALLAASAGAGNRRQAPGGRRIGIDNPYEGPKALLLDAVARANRCRCVWSQSFGFATLVGFATDVDAVETLFTSLLVQATQALTREGSRQGPGGRARSRSFRSSFLTAFALRIGQRLQEATQGVTDAAVAEAGEQGRTLLPVLASRERAVEEAFAEMFPTTVTRSVSSVSDARGWYLGQSAADRASLAAGPALPR
ncbi:MAG: DUF2786 domain-containing protein [Kineosporiaceae bacterium]